MNNRIAVSILALALCFTPHLINARILNVPEDFENIQGGIDEAEDGDTVLVQPGVYEENLTTAEKSDITIGSLTLTTNDPAYIDSTIIDGGGDGEVLNTNHMQRDAQFVLRGFTIRNGNGNYGGILVTGRLNVFLADLLVTENQGHAGVSTVAITDVHLQRLTITDNATKGIWISATRASMEDCEVSNNQGGGGYMGAQRLSLTNVAFLCNDIYGLTLGPSTDTPLILDHLTIAGTRMVDEQMGCGLVLDYGLIAVLTNSIIYLNEGSAIRLEGGPNSEAALTVSYGDIEGGEDEVEFTEAGEVDLHWGEGNIDENPLFADPDEDDFHLTEDSPCIDAGDPESPNDPDGTRADMGAFYYDHRGNPPRIIEHIPEELNLTVEICDTVLFSVQAEDQEGDSILYLWRLNGDTLSLDTLLIIIFDDLGEHIVQCDVSDGHTLDSVSWDVNVIDLAVSFENLLPSAFILYEPYPNPFNSSTTITYQLPHPAHVSLVVYDLCGRMVDALIDEQLNRGVYNATWQADNLASGLYFVQLEAGDRVKMRKVVLIR